MDLRKDYAAPAIAAEDVLEQTSLACNVTQPLDNGSFIPGGGGEIPCDHNPAKGNSFTLVLECPHIVTGPEGVSVLS